MREISIFKKAPVVNGKPDYVVRDLALAGFGRKEIDLAETEMPGLMAPRFAESKPPAVALDLGDLPGGPRSDEAQPPATPIASTYSA